MNTETDKKNEGMRHHLSFSIIKCKRGRQYFRRKIYCDLNQHVQRAAVVQRKHSSSRSLVGRTAAVKSQRSGWLTYGEGHLLS